MVYSVQKKPKGNYSIINHKHPERLFVLLTPRFTRVSTAIRKASSVNREPSAIAFRQKLGKLEMEYLYERKQCTLTVKLRNDDDFAFLNVRIDICGAIWNAGCTIMREYYKNTGKTMTKAMLYSQLGEMRKHTPSWQLVYSQTVQQIADRILAGYELFFTNIEKKKNGAKLKCSPPKCHKIRKQKSMTFKQYGKGFWFSGKGEVTIQGRKFRYYDSYDGLLEHVNVHTMTVKRNSLGEIFLYITCAADTKGEIWGDRAAVGMDFGLKRFLTLSDGTVIDSPLWYKEYLNEIRKLNRKLSRRQGGKPGEKWSKGYKKALAELARLHQKIANQRKDWFHKLARELCKRYHTICIEDLNIKAMQMHKNWGRKVSDLAFSEFVKILESTAEKFKTTVVEIGTFFPSSKTCSCCGHIHEHLDLKDRVYVCEKCGFTIDRDLNAAINILREGLRILEEEKAAKTA